MMQSDSPGISQENVLVQFPIRRSLGSYRNLRIATLVDHAMPQLDGGNTCQVVNTVTYVPESRRTTDKFSLVFTREPLQRLIHSFVQ